MKYIFTFTILFVLARTISPAQESLFGKNKVQYHSFDWYYIQSSHFDIYFTEGGEELATFTADEAEKAYRSIARSFRYNINNRVPIIVYNSHNDFQHQYKNGRWDYVHSFPGNRLNGNPNYRYHGFLTAIRGNTANDIVVAGEFNTLRHFNGAKWSEVGLPYNPLQSSPNWYSCDIKGNSALVGGTGSGRGLVMRLWR
jgi:hypothetical protein